MLGNRLVMGYLLLVGAPLLVLFTALEAGKSLVAPPAVSGEWILAPPANSQPEGAWPGLLAALRPPVLTVSQSGTELTLTLNDTPRTRFAGTLESGRIAAIASQAAAAPGCGGNTAIRLKAVVAGSAGQRSLDGELWLSGCPSCAPSPFTATRRPAAKREGR